MKYPGKSQEVQQRVKLAPKDELVGFGARLAITRIDLGLTQVQFAKALGFSHIGYHAYERGKRDMPVRGLIALGSQFDVNIHWLVTGEMPEVSEGIVKELNKFEEQLDTLVAESRCRIKPAKLRAIIARWLTGRLANQTPAMDDVRIWMELLKD